MSPKASRTDWHDAIFCALQIDLKDYSHLLEFQKEYTLSPNGNRIDMLVIKKYTDFLIPKHIAHIFRGHNLFEIKGFHSSLNTDAYYKTNGHAGYYIDQFPDKNFLNRQNISLTFPTFHYPRNLFYHLTTECGKTIEKPFPGVYYILNEMYATQVLVMKELSPEDSLFLRCLAREALDPTLINQLARDCQLNSSNELYTRYMNQFFHSHTKGGPLMICEGLLNYFGTSSEELLEQGIQRGLEQGLEQGVRQTQALYLPQIEKLTEENNFLKQLLEKNNISY